MRSLEQVNIRTNVRTYERTYSHTYVRDRPYIPSTTLLCEGIKTIFLIISKKTIVRYKKIGYKIDVLRQTACLVVNPIKVNSFAYLFNCTTLGRASD